MESSICLPVWSHDDPDLVEPILFCNATMTEAFKNKFKEGEFDLDSYVNAKVCEYGDFHKQPKCSDSEEPQPQNTYFYSKSDQIVTVLSKLK